MNRRNFFRMAAQFVLGCALAVKAELLISTVTEKGVPYDEKALRGSWIFVIRGQEMPPIWDASLMPAAMIEGSTVVSKPNPDWASPQPKDIILMHWELGES